MKILICGNNGSGKDTVAKILSNGKSYVSATRWLLHHAIWPQWGKFAGFIDEEECLRNKHLHREKWQELADEYCRKDKARLLREVFKVSDIYCGIRNPEQFIAGKKEGLFDASIFIDASGRGITGDCDIFKEMCDLVVRNNHTLARLERRIKWMKI